MANQYLTVQQAQYLLEKWKAEAAQTYVAQSGGHITGNLSIENSVLTIDSTSAASWLSNLGGVPTESSVTPGAVSVPNSSDTTIGNTGSLTRGHHYLILGTASFPNNSNGIRALFLATSSTGSNVDRFCLARQLPVNGAATYMQVVYICNPSSNTTYYLRAFQNSGGSLSVTGGLRVLRFA